MPPPGRRRGPCFRCRSARSARRRPAAAASPGKFPPANDLRSGAVEEGHFAKALGNEVAGGGRIQLSRRGRLALVANLQLQAEDVEQTAQPVEGDVLAPAFKTVDLFAAQPGAQRKLLLGQGEPPASCCGRLGLVRFTAPRGGTLGS